MQTTSPATPANSTLPDHLVEALTSSTMYQNYERAFTSATGLPMTLRSTDSWKLPLHGKRGENPFCALMAKRNGTCAACLRMQADLAQRAANEPCTLPCSFGLTESAVPVRNGRQVVAMLQTGQVFRKKPDEAQVQRAKKKLAQAGIRDTAELEEAYRATPVVDSKRYDAAVQLLGIFARQLASMSNELVIQETHAEPPVIVRAKAYIRDHTTEELSLQQVARAVNTSTSYFCRLFKRVTGINFTQYLSRVRLEQAKQLLHNRNLRVSEVAFEVGFQSLTHFNRVFKKMLGESPTEFRQHAVAPS